MLLLVREGIAMKKKAISIDESLCIGCGNCTTSCHQGALKIIDGKAKLVKEDFCDGLGKCIGQCPTDALKIVEKEVEVKHSTQCSCPGSMMIDRNKSSSSEQRSELKTVASSITSC